MTSREFFNYLGIMAIVTYLIRVIPFVMCKRVIKQRFIKSFLEYIPYTVLAAMTFPTILYSTASFLTGGIGMAVAVIVAYYDKGLVKVSLAASLAVLILNLLI
ncbi:MAG TPA: AzlD domain-containing protein [Lachnospiraceae bacterium]|nr:AzlD domain-containing protein [Lachnospiraceae bacterium]